MNWKILFGLVVSYFIYLLIGGAIFMAIEGPYNKDQCIKANKTVMILLSNISRFGPSSESLRALTQELSDASGYGYSYNFRTNESNCADNWSFEGAVFFSGTVVTTIGYGNLFPKSALGRGICIIYALIGIPLFALMFTGLGEKIAALILRAETRINGRAKRTWIRKVCLILVVSLIFTVLCLLIPSAIFQAVEPWSYGDAFYYSFVTITTIGFGDLVAGTENEAYIPVYRIMVYFWILFGMAFMATVMTLITDFYKETGKKGQRRIQNRKQGNGSKPGDQVDGQEMEKDDPNIDNRAERDGDNADADEYIEMGSKPGIYTVDTSDRGYENTKPNVSP